jgi:two-component system sensor histidine kinase KdpD
MKQLARSLGHVRSGWGTWPAWVTWAMGWGAALALDGHVDLGNLAMLMVLTSAVAALWLPGWTSAAAGALAVLAFNWTFVPPRHTFAVDVREHALLLLAMFAVNAIVSTLMARQRLLAHAAERHAQREASLRTWGDTLRDAVDPAAHASALHEALQAATQGRVALLVLTARDSGPQDSQGVLHVGQVDADQAAGLWLCQQQGQPMGPGSGHHEGQPDVYLPLRGRGTALGAAVLMDLGPRRTDAALRAHAQALCDQMGLALQRAIVARDEQAAHEQAQAQGVRNALLAAISHDYRTPLATIMGAASSLQEQTDRLDPGQRQRLAKSIVDETERLSRLTENTLQLARLDAPGVQLRCDWESAEEIVGAVLRRVRPHDPTHRVRARLEPALPLLWCDAMLIAQMLENLVDNALKYSPEDAPVEVLVRCVGAQHVLAVRDRGPGIAPAWRERVFEVFRRGAEPMAGATPVPARSGAGVGLAVCRAIAGAHGGQMKLRPRGHGGCAFECWLPVHAAPAAPQGAEAG